MHSFVALSAATALLFSQRVLGADCGCYKTSAGDYFSTYEFVDFRNGKPDNFDTFFTILESDNYGPETVTNKMTPDNIAFNDGTMSLLTNNDGSNLQKSADIYSKPSALYGSFRMRASITGAVGGVAGFFTYLDAYNEQDIEILTNEPENQIHLTNHNNGGTGNGNPTLNTTFSGSRADFNTYRMDWLPSKAAFIINDDPEKLVNEAIPTKACTLDINMWSAGDGWGGPMPVGESAVMKVQWIEAVYNPSAEGVSRRRLRKEKRCGEACANACKVDGVAAIGVPEPI